jgi:sterol desaturase/sphingolipid hydroxylase (fatty acid hydroxylase superfamily)
MAETRATTGRLFKSNLLEALSRTHIAVPLVMFWGIGAAATVYGVVHYHLAIGPSLALFGAGVIFFTLIEYLAHRNLYHMGTSGSARKARMQYVMHGVHHEHPRDKRRLALPPVVSLVLATIFMSLFCLLMGAYGLAFGGGFLSGYATYLLVHYSVHVYPQPRNFLGVLWKHHNLHHYVGDTGGFGVSSPLWDLFFGTMPADPRKQKALKA